MPRSFRRLDSAAAAELVACRADISGRSFVARSAVASRETEPSPFPVHGADLVVSGSRCSQRSMRPMRSRSPLRPSKRSPRCATLRGPDRESDLDRSTAAGSLIDVATELYDLWFDPNSAGGDMVVECWISHGPRANDPDFAPVPGDWLMVGDGDEVPLRARVIKHSGDRVSVRIQLGAESAAVA